MAKFRAVFWEEMLGCFGMRAVQDSDLGRGWRRDMARQLIPPPHGMGSDELIPKAAFTWQEDWEDDCKLQTNTREPRIIYLEHILQVSLRVWFEPGTCGLYLHWK